MGDLRFDRAGSRIARLLAAAILAGLLVLCALSVRDSAAEGADEAAAPSRSEAEALIVGSNVGGRIEAALGDDFGGLWFEPATAQLHVGVTSADGLEQAREVAASAGLEDLVVATPVESSWDQLLDAQRQLNAHLGDLFARGEARTALAADDNLVIVEIGSTVAADRRAALQRAAAATGVDSSIRTASVPSLVAEAEARCNEFVTGKASCDEPIVSGVTLKSEATGSRCTAGPAIILTDLTTAEKATVTYLLTAGHCIKGGGGIGGKWIAINKAGEETVVGEAVEGLRGEAGTEDKVDVGVIRVENANWLHEGAVPVTPAIAPWNPTAEVEPFAVTAQKAVAIEEITVCVSGQTAGTSCGGTITSASATENFKNKAGEKWTVETLAEVEGTTTGKGTSGGPWFLESTPGEVMGTHVGAGTVGGKTRKWFQPLAVSFANLATAYQLLTTTNQQRVHPAAGPPITASKYPATLTGSSGKKQVFNTEAGKVECESHLEGTLPGKTTTLTLKPKYTSCTAFGFVSASVNVEECTYLHHSTGKVSGGVYEGTVDVVCPTGQSIKIVAGTCKAEIKAQAGLKTVKTTNEGEKLKVVAEVTGLAYTVTGDGFLCPFAGVGNKTNGTYSGEAVLAATPSGSVDVGDE